MTLYLFKTNLMKKFILVTLFITLTLSFVIKNYKLRAKNNVEPNAGPHALTSCSFNQTNGLQDAINKCEALSSTFTAQCVSTQLQKSIRERWNIFVKQPKNNSGIAFWAYNNCSITLNNYGKYNRTYMAWPAQFYNSKVKPSTDSNCTIARKPAVQNAIKGCELRDVTDSARCLIDDLEVSLDEYWNTLVVNSGADVGISYFVYDDCNVTLSNYGYYQRRYFTWKAY